jgi:hypothetical protein
MWPNACDVLLRNTAFNRNVPTDLRVDREADSNVKSVHIPRGQAD